MIHSRDVADAADRGTIKPGSRIYVSGNAATPKVLLMQVARDDAIVDGIDHLASPDVRESLLEHIRGSAEFHNSSQALSNGTPNGFIPFERIG